jgi:signal transduction histidine kinase
MNISKRLAMSHGAMALVMLVVVVLSSWLTDRINRDFQSFTTQTMPVVRSLENLRFAGLRIVSATAEYVLFVALVGQAESSSASEGDDGHAEGEGALVESGKALYLESLANYESLVREYFPDELPFVMAIREAGEALLATSDELMGIGTAVDTAELKELHESFESAERRYLAAIGAAIDHELVELSDHVEDVHGDVVASTYGTWFGFGVVAIFVFTLGAMVTRSIRGPLKTLTAATERVAARDFSTEISVHAQDEVGALSRAFNTMAADLQTHMAESQAARAALGEAKDSADKANRAKSDFLSAMSHELRTPLNAILGFGQLLEEYSDQPLSDEQKTNVEQILAGGRHLLTLVNEILDLSKIESGEIDISLEPVDPAQFIQETLQMVQPLADEREVSLIVDPAVASASPVMADPGRLKQVLLNVLSNAVKYDCDKGSVTVGAAAIDNAMMRISITDTGPGIPADSHDEVFRPFSRLGAEASNIQGTGIGLTISRQLMESMGGSLDFESTVGEGSTFWIEIPLAES